MSDTIRTDASALSEFVIADDKASAIRAAKAALIGRNRAPGYAQHVEDFGDGTWEVVFTNRPLRADQSFNAQGVRIGTGGSKADALPASWAS